MNKHSFYITYDFPDYVRKVGRVLRKEGFKAYLVGGALRDIVLGIEPSDFDIATDARPEDVLSAFPRSISVGQRFGTVVVLVKDSHGETFEVEVTTFRSEADYVDGRWPSSVEFVDDLYQDLGRRDFTFNAMALDLARPLGENRWLVEDPFNGKFDLERKIIRTVGTPIERFKEDGLRTFKACRMASQLGFEVEEETFDAIKKALPVARMVSMERIRDEFMKMLLRSSKPSIGIECMRKSGLLEIFMPELLEAVGVEQKLYHSDDVYHHLLRTMDIAPDRIKLAALFHDIGKPRCDMGDGHFYGHDVVGADMTKKIMKRMRFSNSEIQKVVRLVRNHMFFFPHYTDDMSEEERKRYEQHKWTDSAIRRFIARVGEDNLDDLFALRIADASSNMKSAFRPEEIEQLQARISEVLAKDSALSLKDLAVNGEDLKEIGIKPGPQMGEILQRLLDIVLDDPTKNDRDVLLNIAKDWA